MFDFKLVKRKDPDIPKTIRPAAVKGMWKAMLPIKRTSQNKYLSSSGPTTLGTKSGKLKKSIKYNVFSRGNDVIGQIGTNSFYGIMHEQGTARGNKVREFLRPAVDDNKDKIDKFIEAQILKLWES